MARKIKVLLGSCRSRSPIGLTGLTGTRTSQSEAGIASCQQKRDARIHWLRAEDVSPYLQLHNDPQAFCGNDFAARGVNSAAVCTAYRLRVRPLGQKPNW
jgi:hypothetical protein